MLNEIVIREERKKDYHASENMVMRAFYNVNMPGCDEHFLLHKLRHSNTYHKELSLVAELNGKIVGGIFYSDAYLVDSKRNSYKALTFGPLAVDPDYQQQGIGKALILNSIKLINKTEYKAVIIMGVPTYYPRFGFLSCYKINLFEGIEKNQFDALMGLPLYRNFFKSKTEYYFSLPEVYLETITQKDVDEFEKGFPLIKKEVRHSQWREPLK